MAKQNCEIKPNIREEHKLFFLIKRLNGDARDELSESGEYGLEFSIQC